MAARRRTTRKKNHNRSGFLAMFLILVVLGSVIYYYRDRFLVLFDTGVSTGKHAIVKKDREHKAFELIGMIEGLTGGKKKSSKSETVEDKTPVTVVKEKKIEKEEVVIPVKKTVSAVHSVEKKPVVQEKPKPVPVKTVTPAKKKEVSQTATAVKQRDATKTERNVQVSKVKSTLQEPRREKKTEAPKETVSKAVSTPSGKQITSKIYLSVFSEERGLELVSAYRRIETQNTPLTSTLQALLHGPTADEEKKNIVTNVPPSTVLYSVQVKGGIAYINLSEAFENNPYGRESTLLQLKQIVYTATEFTNVKGVQFLINGQVKSYIGGDGINISKPLTRNDFS